MAENLGKPQVGKKKKITIIPQLKEWEPSSLPGHMVHPSNLLSYIHANVPLLN